MTATIDRETGEITERGGVDLAALTRPFKPESIRYRDGGGNRKLAYLDGATVIRRLNEATGFRWDFIVVSEDAVPIFDQRNTNPDFPTTLLRAHGRLTIPGLGSRDSIGVQEVKPGSGVDFHKGHYTDALKKCATLFGVGLELYGPDHEAEDDADAQQVRHQDASARVRPAHDEAASHLRSMQPPRAVPSTRRPQEPDGQDRARANIEQKCRDKGVGIPDGAGYDTIAEAVNRALAAAGSAAEVIYQDGHATPGAILNALLALPNRG